MGYRIKGRYLASCDCTGVCPCPTGGQPSTETGECQGVAAFAIDEGELDGTDLGGVVFALYNYFPSSMTSGGWKLGVVVDTSASAAQAAAIERIVSGQEGGPFADLAPLVGDYGGLQWASIIVSGSSASVSGRSDFTFEPSTEPDGSPTTRPDGMFGPGFGFEIGRASGHSEAFGRSFEASYGERADFDYTSEPGGAFRPEG